MSSVNLDDILQLPAPDRLELIEKIWESLAANPDALPLTDAQRAELDRRLDTGDGNPGDVVSAEEMKSASAELRARLRSRE